MKRIKSIDSLRGLSIVMMFLGHLQAWWLATTDLWLAEEVYRINAIHGSTGFILISGVSSMLWYRSRLKKSQTMPDISFQTIRGEHLFRTMELFIIAIMFNIGTAFLFGDPRIIWKWFILQTIAISLFMGWFFFKASKSIRILACIVIWIGNELLLFYLLPSEGQMTPNGVLFYILYNSLDQNTILYFFPYFLIGTVFGDIIFDIYQIEDERERKQSLLNKLLYPSLVSGVTLIILSIFLKFPEFFTRGTFSWFIFAMGIELMLLPILLSIEEFEIFKTKKRYRFLYFFSYYSLTLYIAHTGLGLLFFGQLNAVNNWFFIAGTIFIMYLLIRLLYKYLGPWASIKAQMGKIAVGAIERIYKQNE
jgi:uncharacterized membrane protein